MMNPRRAGPDHVKYQPFNQENAPAIAGDIGLVTHDMESAFMRRTGLLCFIRKIPLWALLKIRNGHNQIVDAFVPR